MTEADAFDDQILERVENGHIPDLQNSGRCEWFANNVWRDSEYAGLFFGGIVEQIEGHLEPRSSILEVGCGPGHICLELARAGHSAMGIDLSEENIKVAIQTANEGGHGIGLLHYLRGDVATLEFDEVDMVVFANSLHHFKDLGAVLKKASSFLKPGGLIYVSEPHRGDFNRRDAAVVISIRELLWKFGCYHEPPGTREEVMAEFNYTDHEQSPHDNSSNLYQMMSALTGRFATVEYEKDHSFYDRILGGLRCERIEEEHEYAEWIYALDKRLTKAKLMTARQFHFVGRKS